MKRRQIITAVLAIIASWYAMMAVHEAGHCLGAVLTGAHVDRLEIPWVGFSRTDVSGGSSPLLVVWAGPVFGSLAPLVLLGLLAFLGRRARQVIQYFVGFCLVANGAYIGGGAFEKAGDCRDLLQHGASMPQLLAFGVVSLVAGFFVWHRMGPLRTWFADVSRTPEEMEKDSSKSK